MQEKKMEKKNFIHLSFEVGSASLYVTSSENIAKFQKVAKVKRT